MRPLIGITTDSGTNRHGQPLTELNDAYSRAVQQEGGIPLLIPSMVTEEARGDLFGRLDGILFSGGGDVEPRRYGLEFSGRLVGVDAARDDLELDLIRRACGAPKPFLGICRGCQVLNVALGGTLHADLPVDPGGPIQHDLPGSERAVLVHDVRLVADSLIGRILGEGPMHVNSHHHQGIHSVGSGLRAIGSAPDGLVEVVELKNHPFGVAVQWHPEWLTDQEPMRKLFRSFVEAASA